MKIDKITPHVNIFFSVKKDILSSYIIPQIRNLIRSKGMYFDIDIDYSENKDNYSFNLFFHYDVSAFEIIQEIEKYFDCFNEGLFNKIHVTYPLKNMNDQIDFYKKNVASYAAGSEMQKLGFSDWSHFHYEIRVAEKSADRSVFARDDPYHPDNQLPAPTFTQAIEWLYKHYQLEITIGFVETGYYYTISKIKNEKHSYISISNKSAKIIKTHHDAYNQAILRACKFLREEIKKKKYNKQKLFIKWEKDIRKK